MRAGQANKIAASYRFHLGGLLVLCGLMTVFGLLTIMEFSPGGAVVSLDFYLIICAILIVAGGAFFQLHAYNRQQSQILAMQRKENVVMRAALDTHAIVSVTGPDGQIIDVNDRFVETFGYSRHEAIGQTPHFIHDAADGPNFFLQIRNQIAGGEPWSGEHSALTKSGERRWFKATVVPMTDKRGRLLKSISIRTDVTELRAAEANRQLSALLDNLQDEVYIYRVSDLSITYMNNVACDRFGWHKDDLKGRSILETNPKMSEEKIRSVLAPLVSGELETAYVQLDDPDMPTEISTSLFEQADRELVFISVVRDITERQALARAKLSSVSVVSHELRTPLTSSTSKRSRPAR